ncbi:YajG family lipoprotein [Metallibacterium sp.]
MKQVLLVALAVALLSGCAFNAQTVNLRPTVPNVHSTIGQGVSVAVRVFDERASKSLGHRGGAEGAAAEITTNSNVAALVAEQVTRALQDKGFTVLGPNANGNAKLTVDIRLLQYSTSVGFWTGGIEIQATLEAKAEKAGKKYEKMYRVKNEQRAIIVPTADKNAEWINQALGDVITKLVSDQKLLTFLAS